MKNVLIVGATSAIATECARTWAAGGAQLFLVARNRERLAQTADDLRVRGARSVHECVLDMNDLAAHTSVVEACVAAIGSIDVALVAHGTLPNQAECEADVTRGLLEFSSNGLSAISILSIIANQMSIQKAGTIVVISSVAGDRGRFSNYFYGAAKAAVSTFSEGLRARLFHVGVNVLTVKPGFVDTPMTRGLDLPGPLVATAEHVARDILRAIDKGAGSLYTPWFWAWIMLVIKLIPGPIFKRLKL